MEFQCLKHGRVDKFELDGYSIAHEPKVSAHEKDFEGITFIVDKPDDGEISEENIRSENASHYLSKFAGWKEEIAETVQNYYNTGRGVEELRCPHDHTGVSITHIVDEIFDPDFEVDIRGSFTVYDGVLEVYDIQNVDESNVSRFLQKLLTEAQDKNIGKIKLQTPRVDLFKAPLQNVGFDVNIKNYSRRSDQLTAEKVI